MIQLEGREKFKKPSTFGILCCKRSVVCGGAMYLMLSLKCSIVVVVVGLDYLYARARSP